VDDVFAVDAPPPPGWVHAIFHGGPYDHDVGRCVPGPPHPKQFAVEVGGRRHIYYLTTVGSWSDPNDPIAHYQDGRLRLFKLRVHQLYQRHIEYRRLRWKFRRRPNPPSSRQGP
jgi:hypothetical protein